MRTLILLLLALPALAVAQTGDEASDQTSDPARANGEPVEIHPLAQRAATSDVVVLAQLDRTDYEYTRGFPIDGRAWFDTLLSYKAPRVVERFIVKESGLKDIECYFPEVAEGQEPPRYLLFLVRDPEDGWRGHPDGCAFEVLVNADNRYVLRWPQAAFGGDGGRGDATIEQMVQAMVFQGPRARIDASDLLVHQRAARAEAEFMRVDGSDLLPTRGIELGDFRRLISPGLVDEEGSLRAREQRRAATLRQALDEADRSGDG